MEFWLIVLEQGSVLIIGSAAGVAIMGILKIDFFWYLRRITFLAFIGYVSGAFTYWVLNKNESDVKLKSSLYKKCSKRMICLLVNFSLYKCINEI